MAEDKPCLLLCDNGEKIKEFRAFAKYLKKGDVIMAHDYCKDGNYFNDHIRGVHWNFCEIGDGHVQDICDKYNLVPFMQEMFINVVWKICKKE